MIAAQASINSHMCMSCCGSAGTSASHAAPPESAQFKNVLFNTV